MIRTAAPRRRESERGFALLLVFLMAAAIALLLYRQIPRVAFESERDKEQVLIDRGEGYRRGVQLFYVANKRFPTNLDELEKFQDKRYLRRRYKDPITGKDEWRLVHSNGVFLTDSLVTKPPAAGAPGQLPTGQQNAATTPTGVAGQPAAGQVADAQPAEVNAAVLRRPSDRPNTPEGGFGGFTPPPVNPDTDVPRFDPNTPISLTPATGQPGLPGAAQANRQFPQQGAAPGAQPFAPQFPGQQFPGQTPLPGQAQGSTLPGQAQTPQQPTQYRIDADGRFVPITAPQPGQPQLGVPQPGTNPLTGAQPQQNGALQPFPTGGRGAIQPTGATPQAGSNPAINIINQLLTTPSQPPAGLGGALPGGITSGAIGIAGVASTSTAASIKRYKDRAKYSEWEFVFDLQQQQQQAQGQQNRNAQTGNQTPGTSTTPGSSPFPSPGTTPAGGR